MELKVDYDSPHRATKSKRSLLRFLARIVRFAVIGFTAISFAFFVSVAALWIRGLFVLDAFDWSAPDQMNGLSTHHGFIDLCVVTSSDPPPVFPAKPLIHQTFPVTPQNRDLAIPVQDHFLGFAYASEDVPGPIPPGHARPVAEIARIPLWFPLVLFGLAPSIWVTIRVLVRRARRRSR